jgi:2-polyprenyl-3-methyl-5-hydroxy-6-metoxy-1,4-benzoquinol methylase
MHELRNFSPSLLLEDLLPAGSLLLDLGCGTGLHAGELARAGYRVVAADMDFDAVATGREMDAVGSRLRLDYAVARAESLPCRDGAFDAVVCLDVLHWAADAVAFEAMWDEAWRVLKPGGLFLARARMQARVASEDALRVPSSAGAWFLAGRALLDASLQRARGVWIVPPESDGQGIARMLARKAV